MSSSQKITVTKQNFDSINIMRGIAILMVILVHTSHRIEGDLSLSLISQYGQLGVQMFFVASAFTLCYSMDYRRKNNDPLRNFYIRRYFRVAPGYYLGIALYFFVTLFISGVWSSNKEPLNILTNIFFMHGLFPPANNSVVPGGWSIGTEMLFYLIFPLIYFIYIKFQNKYKLFYLLMPFFILLISILIQFIFYLLIQKTVFFNNNGFIYYSILNQLPVFCVGMSLYTAFKNDKLNNIKKSTCIVSGIFFTLMTAFTMFIGPSFFIFSSAVFPFFSAISFTYLFILLHYFLPNKGHIFAKIGIVSFSGYLVHFIFTFYLVTTLSEVFHFIHPDIQLILFYIITIVLTYFSSKFIYQYIEKPGTKLGKNLINYLDNKEKIRKEIKPLENKI